jgi:pimeloyl-ACP methyl ester carboxylesterase
MEAMADDVAGLLKYLNIETADVMGYSLGGGVALRIAIQHPTMVKKLILVSTAYKRDGWYPEVLAGMSQIGPQAAEPMKRTPMYQTYAAVAPRPGDWPTLLTKMGELLRRDYDWSSDVAESKCQRCWFSPMAMQYVPRMLWNSFSFSEAVRRMVAGTALGCPTHGLPFCLGLRTTTFSRRTLWRRSRIRFWILL